ncbi:MAG: GGDEF domain-containing protein [Deltaproteobacteria bacterium]|nr:GGDEF domain-containing protein [Deltaproteobacteria bacterium]
MKPTEYDSTNVTELARQGLYQMSRLAIPITPDNYRLWFNYVSRSMADLVAEVDDLLSTANPFNPVICENLYQKYFGADRESKLIRLLHDETREMLKDLFGEMLNTHRSASEYGSQLGTHVSKLEQAMTLQEVREIVGGILSDTDRMVATTRQLKVQLEEATLKTRKLEQRIEETRQEALIDGLTGLNNRKALDRKMLETFQQYQQEGTPLALILLDIDFFKQFNDQYGHPVGDKVLQLMAGLLLETVKGRDFPARYGGEEFAIILPDTGLEGALSLAEQIRSQIAQEKIIIKQTGEKLRPITVSLGVAEIRSKDSVETLIERADRALYLAKKMGRNNVKSEKDIN